MEGGEGVSMQEIGLKSEVNTGGGLEAGATTAMEDMRTFGSLSCSTTFGERTPYDCTAPCERVCGAAPSPPK